MKIFVFDSKKCSGCYNCQIGCKDEHVMNEWLPYSMPQPNSGQFWLKINQRDHGQVPKVRVEYTPIIGAQSEDLRAYAPEVLMPRSDGLIVIDPEKAKGRKDIADKFEGVYWNEELEIPQGCTGCAHLVDEGKLPHCVDLCATGALRFGDSENFKEIIEHAETLPGSEGHVYYINMPHLFISGEVWDLVEDEIIMGAKVSLTLPDGTVMETETDDFGDFWFRGLDEGIYSLHIEADGFSAMDRSAIELNESLNIGDFPLERAS